MKLCFFYVFNQVDSKDFFLLFLVKRVIFISGFSRKNKKKGLPL